MHLAAAVEAKEAAKVPAAVRPVVVVRLVAEVVVVVRLAAEVVGVLPRPVVVVVVLWPRQQLGQTLS